MSLILFIAGGGFVLAGLFLIYRSHSHANRLPWVLPGFASVVVGSVLFILVPIVGPHH